MYSFCWRRLASGELDAVPEEMRIEGAFRHLALRPSSAARVDDQQDGAPDARGAAWQRPPPLTHHRHAPGQVVILSMQQSSGLLHSRARGAGAGRHREAMSGASRRSRRIPRGASRRRFSWRRAGCFALASRGLPAPALRARGLDNLPDRRMLRSLGMTMRRLAQRRWRFNSGSGPDCTKITDAPSENSYARFAVLFLHSSTCVFPAAEKACRSSRRDGAVSKGDIGDFRAELLGEMLIGS